MFKKYDYVYAVYKEGNFTRAAESLFISQPSLSVAVKNIEDRIGAPLFERSGTGVTLTEIGREYIDAAEKIMRVEMDFSRKLHDIHELESGSLTVGGTNYLSSYILPSIINHFSTKHPKINVTLVEANSLSLAEMIESEQIDVVIDSFDDTMDKYSGYPLANEKILLCVPADDPINEDLREYRIDPEIFRKKGGNRLSLPSVPIARFKDKRFILLKSGNDMYNRAMTIFLRAGLDPEVIFRVDQLNIAYALAQSGMGLCFVTDTLFKYGIPHKDVWLYNVDGESGRTLYVAYKRNKYCSRAMSEFIASAKEMIGKS